MKDDIWRLVSLTTDDERDHRVISIWGMGGLGKTTLARKIFNHGTVRGSFEAFAWVCITQQCQIDKVLQDIMKQILGNDRYGDGDHTTLVRELYKVMNEKKCLVVLDDIWKMEDWEILRHAFPVTNTSSKVLLTTRQKEVAKKGFLYKLQYLTEEEGWELLRRKALTKPEEIDPKTELTFELVGKKIVHKCGCLPLGISVLGGILREKSSLNEWEMVNGDIDLYLRRGEGNGKATAVHNVLALSYDELPYYLKPCFLYIGNYREDEIIDAEKLYQLWIAEGFVLSEHCGEAETMMDVAERYLNELASRSMVEVEMDDVSIVQRLESCRLHDLMRDLCLAKGKEEDFFKVIDLDGSQVPQMNLSSLSDDGRRLGMYIYEQLSLNIPMEIRSVKLFEQVKSQYLRTLFIHGIGYIRLYSLDIFDLKKFKLLRVLDLENSSLTHAKLPKEISQLIHLRNSRVAVLPSSISKLPYLQTLDLRTSCSFYLPNIFGKMKRLKHIYLPRYGSENLQFNDLSELETLQGFESSGDGPIDLSGLVNLRSFSGTLDSHALSQFVNQIHSWRKIKWIKIQIVDSYLMSEQGSALLRKVLLCQNLCTLEIDSPIGKFPPYEPQFCPNLTLLRLENTEMEEDPMQVLKNLPNLRSLSLCHVAFVGKEMVCDSMAFPELRFLRLHGLLNLEIWRVDEGAMTNLSHLSIIDCEKLATITDGLNFTALKRFDINTLPKELKQKYKMLHDTSATSSSPKRVEKGVFDG